MCLFVCVCVLGWVVGLVSVISDCVCLWLVGILNCYLLVYSAY